MFTPSVTTLPPQPISQTMLVSQLDSSPLLTSPDVLQNADTTNLKLQTWSSEVADVERFHAHLTTDRPFYSPGDTVHFKAPILHVLNHKPFDPIFQPGAENATVATVQVLDSKKSSLLSCSIPGKQFINSVVTGSLQIPAEFKGGDYTLVLSFTTDQIPSAERKLNVRAYVPPRLNVQIDFLKKGYAPGETAKAVVEVQKVEGGLPKNASITATARIDGAEVFSQSGYTLDVKGEFTVEFVIYQHCVTKGDGSLTIQVNEGGEVEVGSKTIPITLQKVDLKAYPEAGSLIGDVENVVYFETTSPISGNPVDIEGEVRDHTGDVVCTIATEHEGRGRFKFTPSSTSSYHIVITKPSGVTSQVSLPAPVKGVTFTPSKLVFEQGESIAIQFKCSKVANQSATPGLYTVRVMKACRLVGHASITVPQSVVTFSQEIKFSVDTVGVHIVSIMDAVSFVPVAERLIFVNPQQMRIKVTPNATKYQPGDAVKLNVELLDPSGAPCTGVCGVSVVDDRPLQTVDKRLRPARLPVVVFLDKEVDSLDDAHVYLSGNKHENHVAVDYLLGVQGWRRYFLYKKDVNAKSMAKIDQLIGHKFTFYQEISVPMSPFSYHYNSLASTNSITSVTSMVPRMPSSVHTSAVSFSPSFAQSAQPQSMMATSVPQSIPQAATIVRESYAGRPVATAITKRSSFADTIYWNPSQKVERSGTFEFKLNDSITSFRVCVDAFSPSGIIGLSDEVMVESLKPFFVEARVPARLAVNDRAEIPVSVTNNTKSPITASLNAYLQGSSSRKVFPVKLSNTLAVGADTKAVTYISLEVSKEMLRESPVLHVMAKTAGHEDSLSKPISIDQAAFFPESISKGGLVTTKATQKITIPKEAMLQDSPATITVMAYQSQLSSQTVALSSLIRQPYGCFEQTSSTLYPMIFAYQLLNTIPSQQQKNLVKQAVSYMEEGRDRLMGYQTAEGGFDLYGYSPAIEALTAFGIMEFTDMEKCISIDKKSLQRAVDWLFSRQNADGTFMKSSRYSSFSSAPEHTNTAYIAWALSESSLSASKKSQIERSVDKCLSLYKQGSAGIADDAYFLGILGNTLFNIGKQKEAQELALALQKYLKPDGSVYSASSKSITCCYYGNYTTIEVTSLAMRLWIKVGNPNFINAYQYLMNKCDLGRYGTTQSTVLGLKAILLASPPLKGKVSITVDKEQPVLFDVEKEDPCKPISIVASTTKTGEHTVAIEYISLERKATSAPIPYSITAQYYTIKPQESELIQSLGLEFETKLNSKNSTLKLGESAEISIKLKNLENKKKATPIAIVGIPNGVEVRVEKLQELKKAGRISMYETTNGTLVLYWYCIEENQTIDLLVDVVARTPGTFTGVASTAYLYYADDLKKWNNGITVTITK